MEKPEKECAPLPRSPNENFADKPLSKKKFSYEIKHMNTSPYKISIKKNNFHINNASEPSNLPSQNPDHLQPSLNFIRDDLYDPVINTESLVLKSESYNKTRETSAENLNKTARRLSGNTFNKPPRLASNPIALYNQTQTIFRNQPSNHIITGSAFNKLGHTTKKPNPNTNQTNNVANNYYHNHLYQKARNTYTSTQFQLKRNFLSSPNPTSRPPNTANSQGLPPGSYTDNFINRANQITKTPQKNTLTSNFPHASPPHPNPPPSTANRYTTNPQYMTSLYKPPHNHNIRVTSIKPPNTPLTLTSLSSGQSRVKNGLMGESNENVRDTMHRTGFRVTDSNFYMGGSHVEDNAKGWENELILRGELGERGRGVLG